MTTVIIQARISSTRLPGKTLAPINGEPILSHLVRRAKLIPHVAEVIVATTTNPADERILRFADENGLRSYRGSENDVLDRFYQTARKYQVSAVVRVTPDCPLMDPSVAGLVVDEFVRREGEVDYVS